MNDKLSLGVTRPYIKLNATQEQEVLRLLNAGLGLELVAVKFGVHSNTVRNIRRRQKEALVREGTQGTPQGLEIKPSPSDSQEGTAGVVA